MATFTIDPLTDDGYAPSWDGSNRFGILKKQIDFSETANNLVQNGIVPIFKIPAHVRVTRVQMYVDTADTDIATSGYLGAYSRNETTLAITEIDADGFGVTGQVMSSTGYVAQDVDAVYNGQGSAPGYVSTSAWYVTFTNIDTDTINEAVVTFIAEYVDYR